MLLPKVSVIIINYNGKELLEKCLESLFKVKYNNFEVVVVDNNSNDNTIDFLTKNYPTVIIIKLDSNKGFAEPNNIAAKITKGDFLLFLNNDTIVTPNFISEMIEVIKNDEKISICQSLLLKSDNSIDSSGDFIDELGVCFNSKSRTSEIQDIFSARGASMLIDTKIFNLLGGFDEKFFATFEDVDLGWRSWILGYKSVLVPKSIVYHIGGQTVNIFKNDIAFHGFKNQLAMKITNFESRLILKKLFQFFLKYGIRELKIWFDYKINGKTTITPTKYESELAAKPNFKIIFKSIFWILQNFYYLRKKHIQVNNNRKLSTESLIKINIMLKR
jgi:GT2 family glycosyltransferase